MGVKKTGTGIKKLKKPLQTAVDKSNEKNIDQLIKENLDSHVQIEKMRWQIKNFQGDEIQINKLKNLIEINTYISHSLEKGVVLNRILDQIVRLLDCELGSILLVDEETQCLKFAYLSKEEDSNRLKNVSLKIGEGIAGTVWDNGTSIIINDAQSDARFSKLGDIETNYTTHSILAVPLTVNGLIIGVIEAINKRDSDFNDFDLQLLQYISTQSAIAIKNADLYDMAIRDGMTKLFMHKYFLKRLEEELKRSRRYKKSLSLVMFDIDHFKQFNDTYGHQAGDLVLKEFAAVIRDNCRATDIPCRYGGEEFSVILTDTSSTETCHFSERVRASIEQTRINYNDSILAVTISAGIACIPNVNPLDIEEFIKMSDAALYHSKNNGRNQVNIFNDEMKRQFSKLKKI